jgi:methionine salvage enolase-phosphatase E1
MNNAEKYFESQKQNPEFVESYNQISEQIDIDWELERVKNHIQKGVDKNIIISELEKLQNFIHQAIYIPKYVKKSDGLTS